MSHVFDETIAVSPIGPQSFAARTRPAYNNMVGPFGGATAATVVNALQQHPQAQGAPLALTINYLAPVAEGEWTVTTQPLRTNRTNQHWAFTAEQNDSLVASGTAVFGLVRDTWHDTEARPPVAGEPGEHPESDFPDFIAWAKNYEKRFVSGSLDFADPKPSDDSTTTQWIRDAPARPLDYPAITAIADSFYPRVFLRRGVYLPAGTISLTVYYHATPDELAEHGDDYLLGTARSARFGHGHFDHYGQLWSRGGTLLATTHQLAYFKDPA